ncbi:MAG: hypothetical protein QM703_27770 [Gemmatales bacterium]
MPAQRGGASHPVPYQAEPGNENPLLQRQPILRIHPRMRRRNQRRLVLFVFILAVLEDLFD